MKLFKNALVVTIVPAGWQADFIRQ